MTPHRQADVGHRELPWPPVRNVVVDFLRAAHRTHTIHGFTELDITDTWAAKKAAERELGRAVSFTAFLVWALARAVDEDRSVQARRWRGRLVVFDDVDVNTIIEKTRPGGIKVPVGYIVRAANRKSLAQIDAEQRRALRSALLDDAGVRRRARLARLPALLRRLIWRRIERDPWRHKEHRGTVALTNPGHYALGHRSWGAPLTPLPLTLTLGGVYEGVRFVDGRAEPRRMLCVTISVDHDITDGGPATRFFRRLVRLVGGGEAFGPAFIEESRKLDTCETPEPSRRPAATVS